MHIDDLFIKEAHRQYGIDNDLVETLLNLVDLRGMVSRDLYRNRQIRANDLVT